MLKDFYADRHATPTAPATITDNIGFHISTASVSKNVQRSRRGKRVKRQSYDTVMCTSQTESDPSSYSEDGFSPREPLE
ncbi:hypothetical protein E4U42_000135 [Claviceps africana]|uniref:Uncharacterized protein n=1 Tax=Claviceps africana TaxID=83212 RepID=A0A8K0JAX7_9HYPO|nr:hypothetical protein E4U42_000135 [Claviceps africana]